jgi:hypothetical protein
MKNKFNNLMGYFKVLNCKELDFNVTFDHKFPVDYNMICVGKNVDGLSGLLEMTLLEICEKFGQELYDVGPGSSYSETSSDSNVNIFIDTKSNSLIFKEITFIEYDTESDGLEREIDEIDDGNKIREFLLNAGLTEIKIGYTGGGDDGSLEYNYTTEDGKIGEVPNFLDDICYNLLEEFIGWEMNEGSAGKIIINSEVISISHNWNIEREYTNKINLIITKDSFDE